MSKNRKAKNKSKAKSKSRVNYTDHAITRMVERVITQAEVEEAIAKGTYVTDGAYVFNVYYNNLRIVVKESPYSRKIKVITVLHDKEFEDAVAKRASEENRSIRSIMKEIKNIPHISRLNIKNTIAR